MYPIILSTKTAPFITIHRRQFSRSSRNFMSHIIASMYGIELPTFG